MRAPGVARLGCSAMVVANLECDLPGSSPGFITDLRDGVSDGCARIVSASIFFTGRDGWSQLRIQLVVGNSAEAAAGDSVQLRQLWILYRT